MSAQIKEALLAAKQEAEAWEAIEAWLRSGGRKRDIVLTPVGGDGWTGTLLHGGRLALDIAYDFRGIGRAFTRLEALTKAAAWCHAQGATK